MVGSPLKLTTYFTENDAGGPADVAQKKGCTITEAR